MFSCALHNWFSYDFPCSACEKQITSTEDIVINSEGINETVPYESSDKIEYWRNKYLQLQQLLKEKDLIIHGLEEGSAQWEEEYRSCRRLLQELVDLKELKDKYGKTELYNERQPKAWESAKEFLKQFQHL